MLIPAAAAGGDLGSVETELTPRRLLAFAAGLGLSDECYLDDGRPGGPAMMPAMCAAIEWPLADGNASSARMGVTLAQYRSVGVHAEQDTIFHRPPRAGETLRTSAVMESLRQTRAGVLMSLRCDSVDGDGQPVITSYMVGMLRGWKLDAPSGGTDSRDLPGPADLQADATSETVHVPRWLPHSYSECSQIWNPIHTEREVALAAGLPDIILHGTATWALAMDRVIRAHAGGDPRRLRRFACRFTGMVIPGEDITVRHAGDGSGRIRVEALDARGVPVLQHGLAEILPEAP
ncbi:MAG: MaoC/PaaZ C-terminal domain-containing protein [Minwuia sp.]|uniref:MaoC/PaaZ C-terminal domain-containing protein n=1 Tax=Minwuia sp. TaxID=2493630 RepID=UPI003A8AAAD7